MNKIEQLLSDLKLKVTTPEMDSNFIEISVYNSEIENIEVEPGKYCGVSNIQDIFSWKRSFSYLWTGTPNAGKTTMSLFMMLIMSVRYGWKWCIWSQEMEDSYFINGKIKYHIKDIVDTLIWTLKGKTPYEYVARKYQSNSLSDSEKRDAYKFVSDHFHFVHCNNRTPAGLLEAFTRQFDKYGIDGFLIDPWKSVKQDINTRSDIWLEDVLMSFKEFSLETNSIMNFVVHPKSLRDYTDDTGNYRVITPFDLNGGAAWFNSMDVIVSLRRLKESTYSEWYSYKIRKQHLVGKPGQFLNINFDVEKYRFLFDGNDPFIN